MHRQCKNRLCEYLYGPITASNYPPEKCQYSDGCDPRALEFPLSQSGQQERTGGRGRPSDRGRDICRIWVSRLPRYSWDLHFEQDL